MISYWARKWNVSDEAIRDLMYMLGATETRTVKVHEPRSESAVQSSVRENESKRGGRLWRNNVGMAVSSNGRPVRYGLLNESAAINRVYKSSDLIGIRPVETSEGIIGQFVAREVKREGWKYAGTPREVAQLRFLELICSMGGDASFTTGEEII